MRLVTLRAGDLEATYAPEAGMVCASLRHRGAELLGQRKGLAAYAESGSTMGVPLLYPWANRLGVRRFTVLGQTVDLDRAPERFRTEEHGLPIHGVATAAGGAWRVEEQSATRLRASLDWSAQPDLLAAFPFPHTVSYDVELDADGLHARFAVTPASEQPVPVAFGLHPYLVMPGAPRAAWRIAAPVRRRLVLDARNLPTGEREAVAPLAGELGRRTFDDAFDGLDGERPEFVLAGPGREVAVRFDAGFPCAQVFAPASDDVVAFEPMTAPVNALVTGEALPRAPHRAAFTIAVR